MPQDKFKIVSHTKSTSGASNSVAYLGSKRSVREEESMSDSSSSDATGLIKDRSNSDDSDVTQQPSAKRVKVIFTDFFNVATTNW